ncbi:MAG: hypothetical protein RSG96_04930 [Clostridia bacterium]
MVQMAYYSVLRSSWQAAACAGRAAAYHLRVSIRTIFSVQLRWSVTMEAAVKSAAEIQNESKTYLQALAIVSKISYNRIDIGSNETKMQRQ